MGNILIIDTKDNKKINVGLKTSGKEHRISGDSKLLKSQTVLFTIDKILKENKLKIDQVNGIMVDEGPGSFTGLRIGISIANALGFLLGISINDKKIGEIAIPLYNK